MKKELLFEKTPRCSMRGAPLKCRSLALMQGFSVPKERFYIPMQLVAPRAVTIAVAIDAIICTMNLMVSLLVMVLIFKYYHFYNFYIVQRVGA